jgi:hypothetical protein
MACSQPCLTGRPNRDRRNRTAIPTGHHWDRSVILVQGVAIKSRPSPFSYHVGAAALLGAVGSDRRDEQTLLLQLRKR